MENRNPKNILVVCGIQQGHFTGSVEIIRELSSLGHSITCYAFDEYKERLKNTGAKVIAYNIDREEIRKNMPAEAPPIFENILLFGRAFEAIISLLSKDETKYDYYIFDCFFDVKEMNKIFNIPLDKYVLIYVSHLFSDENYMDIHQYRMRGYKHLNEKYNLNFHEFLEVFYTPNEIKKLILTSKLFHYKSENCDDTCNFIGPNIEKRKFDENFKFQKDKSKKLIYISCGTIFNTDVNYYKTCIEAFKDSDEYQLIITVGQYLDLKIFQDIPKNISIFNYVPQSQIFSEVDVFITHGGLNSVHETFLNDVPPIIIPQKYDQFDTGRRIDQLEAGIFIDSKKTKITPDVIRDAVKTIVANKEKYKKGVELIKNSLLEAKNNRKNIYEKIFA